MPYIAQERRERLKPHIEALVQELRKMNKGREDKIEGDLNYCCIKILLNGIKDINQKWKYRFINRVSGVLDQIESEFNRRIKDIYEEECIDENGDLEEFEVFMREIANAKKD